MAAPNPIDPSLARALADLDELADAFDLTARSLGDDLLEINARTILAQMEAEKDPEGNRWDELSERYAAWKDEYAPGQPMAVLDHEMRTIEQLRGEQHVDRAEARMTYGLDPDAKAKATWFQEGNAHQPPRPFYALNATTVDEADIRIGDHFLTFTLTP